MQISFRETEREIASEQFITETGGRVKVAGFIF